MAMHGKEGQWFDLSDTEAYGMSCAVSAIPYGRVVVHHTVDNCCRLPDKDNLLASGATIGDDTDRVGVTMFEFDVSGCDAEVDAPIGWETTGSDFKKKTQTISIATQGRIYVRPESDVKPGDKVFYRVQTDATNPLKQALGTMRNDDDGGKAVELKGARFVLQTALAGSCAVIDLNSSYKA